MKKIIIHNNVLGFKPDYITNDYGLTITYPTKKLKIHYQARLNFHKQLNENDRIFSIDRKQLFVNNQLPDIHLYEMADKMAKSIFPVIFRIDKNNEIIVIENYDGISNRCNSLVRELSHYYKDETAEKIISNFKKQYSNAFFLSNQLQEDLFYKLLFFPLHKQYTSELKAETKYSFRFGQKKAIPFLLLHQIQPEYTDSGKLIVNLKSIDNIENSQIFQNTFEASYQLYPEDHSIMSIMGKAIITDDRSVKEIIEFELYHLNVEQRNTKKISLLADKQDRTLNFDEKRNKIFIGEVEDLPKRKGFWSFLD